MWFERARISPVLTAHPTEVQRQSILECEREIARLLALAPGSARERALHAEVLRLWLTAMLRLTKLAVADEIVNALAYFRLTFIAELPRLYEDLEHALRAPLGLAREPWLPPFLIDRHLGRRRPRRQPECRRANARDRRARSRRA